jgi:peptidoglycan/LPS O-acetylase OafA/YrhL
MSSIEASGSKDDASTATLHVMQAIMAVAVLTSHWEYPYDLQYVAQFKVPVDYFFFIEGFLTMQGLFRAAPAPPTWRVIVRRIWRIYPLHVIGLIAGAATFFAAARAQENGWSIDFLEKSLGLGLLLQPIFSAVNEGAVFPLNSPSWAFVVEIWAFAVLFLSRRHLTMRVTGLIFLSAAIVLLAWILLTHDSNLGWRTPNYWGGFPRAICGFFGGAYLFQLKQNPSFKLPQLHPLLIWGVVVASLVVRVPYAWFQLIVLFAVPPIVLLGAASSKPEWLSRFGAWAERHAYGIYLLSYPCLEAFRALGVYSTLPKQTLGNFPAYLVQVALIILVVHLVVSWLDEPIRRWGDHQFFKAPGTVN